MIASLGAALASFVVLAAVFVPLERLFPARPGQKLFRREWKTDAVFFLGQYLVFNVAAVAILGALAGAADEVVPGQLRATVQAMPLWLSCASAVVLGDLSVYGFHRACHRFDFLWRFHAVHHSSEELDWLAAHREHPVDGILTQLCQNLPAIALGVPIQALAAFAVLRAMWAIFVHSNVRLPLGPLRWILGSPELHHWHHARDARTTHNFANVAPWIDLLFGTHHLPSDEEVYALGLRDPGPRGYLSQLLSPLRVR